MSKRVEQLAALVREIVDQKRNSRSWTPMTEIRRGAVSAVAQRFGVTEETIADTFIRRLRPEISSTSEFDNAMEEWLKGTSKRLQLAMLSHLPQRGSPQEDVDEILALGRYVERT